MSPKIDDRCLWLGFGIFFFAAAHGIRYAITDIVRLTAIQPLQKEEEAKEPQPEDAISLETLQTLASSPNHNIAHAAMSMIVSRVFSDKATYDSINEECRSSDPAIRTRAKKALDFLHDGWQLQYDEPVRSFSDAESNHSIAVPASSLELLDVDGRLIDDTVREARSANGDGVEPMVLNPVTGWTAVPPESFTGGEDVRPAARRLRREAMVIGDEVTNIIAEDADVVESIESIDGAGME